MIGVDVGGWVIWAGAGVVGMMVWGTIIIVGMDDGSERMSCSCLIGSICWSMGWGCGDGGSVIGTRISDDFWTVSTISVVLGLTISVSI